MLAMAIFDCLGSLLTRLLLVVGKGKFCRFLCDFCTIFVRNCGWEKLFRAPQPPDFQPKIQNFPKIFQKIPRKIRNFQKL
jgi:hypothetical protein